ncbi:MAG: ATP-binding protein [Pseudomonadota bacterium]|nr:ATP-binding protein [Pseudomonadota bacterium]
MITSIRTFLLVNLLLSVTLSTSLAIIGNIFLEHTEFQTHLDSQLTLSAYTIQAFLDEEASNDEIMEIQQSIDEVPNFLTHINYDINQQVKTLNTLLKSIQFQVWNDEDELILHSYAAPKIKFHSKKTGFDMIWHDGKPWRTFSIIDDKKNIFIMVMQRHDFRVTLEKKITEDSVTIMMIIYPFLGLLIWIIVGRGLQSIISTTEELKERGRNKLTPISLDNIPQEIIPLIKELNGLFDRLSQAFFREKRFAADAAHELKTPLAAISTQAQVALQAKNEKTREEAINKLILSVDRSTHVIQQLLTLSRMVPESTINENTSINIVELTRDIVADIVPLAISKNINLELEVDESRYFVKGNSTALGILIRNLVDNAVKYTQENGLVTIKILRSDKKIKLIVQDNGPGVAAEFKERIFERFFRVIGSKATGSGLGLSIVKQIVDIHSADIVINDNSEAESGLVVTVSFKSVENKK